MPIKTTVNITSLSFDILMKKAKLEKISVSYLFQKIANRVVQDDKSNRKVSINKTVKYQQKNVNYKQVHVILDGNIYESLVDLRKFNKVSVSRILSEAIEYYLLANNKTNSFSWIFQKDNYITNYTATKLLIKNNIYYKIKITTQPIIHKL